ncbi:MAG: hypothetical protein QXN16_00550 [Candidatus Micrarchaeaceae archaeon]
MKKRIDEDGVLRIEDGDLELIFNTNAEDTLAYLEEGDEDEGNAVMVALQGFGFTERALIFESGKVSFYYSSFASGKPEKAKFDNNTQYTYEYLTSKKFKPTYQNLDNLLGIFREEAEKHPSKNDEDENDENERLRA